MATRSELAAADDTTAALTRNVLALTSGLLLWTAGHFGVLAGRIPGARAPARRSALEPKDHGPPEESQQNRHRVGDRQKSDEEPAVMEDTPGDGGADAPVTV
jgi:hypothetical protein